MYKLIAVCVLLTALAGAEPPFYPFQQQQRGDLEPYAAAGPPSGPLLLLPGEYIVPVNSPYQQYGVPDNAEAQINQAPEQEYQTAFIATNQQPFGQLQQAPGVQQPLFFGRLSAGAPQPNEKDAEQFNPQVYNKQQQFTNDGEEQQDERQFQQKPKNNRGNVRFTVKPKQESDAAEESVDRYQQQDNKYQQRGNSRYTQQQQQQYNSAQESDYNQQQPGQYYQPANQQQQPNYNQNQYPRVIKYTPPRKYIPVNRASTTEASVASTTESNDDSTTTEIAITTDANNDLKSESKSNYEETDDVENINEAQGSYYLLLPNGKLQKIVYMTADDLKKMQYIARIQYQTIEPISGPIYAYNPKSAPFVQVF